MSERARDDSAPLFLGRPLALFGREGELASLTELVGTRLGSSSAGATLVTGPAGGGKSRLRIELLRRITSAHPELEVWLGRADPTRAGAPFNALASALRQGLGLLDGEPVDVLQDSLRRRVGLLLPEEDQQRVTLFLGELLGLPFPDDESPLLRAARQDAQLMGYQLRQAWLDVLAAENSLRPILIVLEDVHWADPPSFALVDFALAELPRQPWVVIAFGRPEARSLLPESWARHGGRELALGELPAEPSRTWVREALGPRGDDGVAARLVAAAQGNPRHLEELIRAAAEGREGTDTLEGLSRTRLSALPVHLRDVLRAASIFGRAFRPSGIQALLATTTLAEVRAWLSELAAREFVYKRNEGLPGDEEWGFRSDGLREASYAALSPEEREAWHRIAGEWLLGRGEGDGLLLARHHERGGAAERAQSFLHRAAQQALNAGDIGAAIAWAEAAVTSGAAGELRGALRLVQTEAHRYRGEADLAVKRSVEALAILPPSSGPWFRAMEEAILAAGRQGGYQRVSTWMRQAMSVSCGPDVIGLQIRCLCTATRLLYEAGNYALAEDMIHRIEAMAGDLDTLDPLAAAQTHRALGARARYEGNLAVYLHECQAALRAFERAGDAHGACNARVSVGFAFIELGHYPRSEEELRRALAQAERLRATLVAARARQNLGLVLALRGQLEEAWALELRVLEDFRAQQNARLSAWTQIYLSTIAALRGDAATAEAQGRAAAEQFTSAPMVRAGALAAQTRGLLGLGRAEEAREAMAEAMRVLQTVRGIEEFESQVRLMNAEALEAAGRHDEARAALASARARVLERADKILSPEWRDSFLRNVPENARTLALAEAWGI